jgi:hypothetical protein
MFAENQEDEGEEELKKCLMLLALACGNYNSIVNRVLIFELTLSSSSQLNFSIFFPGKQAPPRRIEDAGD